MNDAPLEKPQLFEAFIKSVQYLLRLKTQQDAWEHLGKFILTHFPAEWVGFVQRDAAREISFHHCTLPPAIIRECLETEEVLDLVTDVLESGFLASRVIAAPTPSMTVFLPVIEQRPSQEVMLVGHKSAEFLPNDLLNTYLAIAGLGGAAIERLYNEIELNRHRAYLEELVKEKTAELENAKRQNELILNSVREGICGVDLERRIAFVNPSGARMLGWAPEDLIGRDAHGTFHHSRPDGCAYPAEECLVNATLLHGGAETVEEEFFRKDGMQFAVEFTTAPITEKGDIVGAVLVFRDITDRKRAEEALRQHREWLRVTLTSIGDAVIATDVSGRIVFLNPVAATLVGWPIEDALGQKIQNVFRIVNEETDEPSEDIFARVLSEGAIIMLANNTALVARDGRKIPIEDSAAPIKDEAGNVAGVVLVFHDVTEKRRAQEELRRSNKDLEQFAYIASHDLQEPLRQIVAFTKFLDQKCGAQLDETARELMDFIVEGSQRMQALIRDLLAFSRVGRDDKEKQPAKIQDILDQALLNLKGSIQESGATLRCDAMPTLNVDAPQLMQVFQNLIGNAVKFRGEAPPDIHVGSREEKDYWQFWVKDNGIGFSQEYDEKIFQIFQRLHARDVYPGSGIGLSICKRAVEHQGGRIWVESEAGKGATFYFTIPKGRS